jgi:hypothetical protein
MTDNAEQFDLRRMPATGEAPAPEFGRFERLTAQAQSLDQIVNTAIWREWEDVIKKQRQLRLQLARAERDFLGREPMPNRAAHKAQLNEDLQTIYDDAAAANLKRRNGQQYYPTRLLVAINRARAGERDPVNLVTDTIRRRTKGLDILLEAGMVELTLEWLVLDESKPYHDLFVERSHEIARRRVAEFRERAAAAKPERA